MFDKERQATEEKIRSYCSQNDIPTPDEIKWMRIPFSGEWGISTSFFQAAAEEARSGKKVVVPERAQEIAAAIAQQLGTPEGFSRVEAVKGYVNLYFSAGDYSRRVIDDVLTMGADYGRGVDKAEQVMVEYSQPNTHKPIHVGHLRNMILGAAICNILEWAGYDVVRANYPGDSGLHVIKWIWNYQKNHAGEEPPEDKIRWMGDIYVEANRLLEENPDLEAEMREVFAQWEARDPDFMALYEKTHQWSREGFDIAYDALDIPFDIFYWQSELDQTGKDLVADLIAKEIAIDERPEGAVVIHLDEILGLEQEKYRVMVILRSDGTALYSTWDLALAPRKFSDYPDLVRSIYIVDVRQSLHLQQVYKTLEIMGYPWTDKLLHLPYEIVNLPGNVTMASREGTVVLLEDLLREAEQRARELVQEKNPELTEEQKHSVAKAVSLGAIKYPMLARDNTKIATFDWESALDFNGQAAPYIQYAHVRANSILKRMEGALPESQLPQHDLAPSEIELIDMISRMPEEIQHAADEFKTLRITNLAYNLARAFNDFYKQCPVLKAPPEVRAGRLRLVAAARQAIANTLGVLGILAPDVM